MDNKNSGSKKICFFDSGIGGLTLMCKCAKRRRDLSFLYFADNYNVPYGNLPHGKIAELVEEKFSLIALNNPAAAVVACNTVTAECITALREKYPFPIIGVQPAVKPAVEECGGCAVLCTPATAESKSLKELALRYGKGKAEIIPCPELAAYIEENIFALDYASVIKLLPETESKSVVLGCTHYNFINQIISKFYGLPVYDGIEGVLARIDQIVPIDWEIFGKNPQGIKSNQEIGFLGGNWLKNYQIFQFLRQNEGF